MTEAKARKPRKPSRKQIDILAVLANHTTPLTPSQVGVELGKTMGSPAADWAFPALKSLVKNGRVEKVGIGRYQLVKEA
jgi:Fe2+ or Zn2+ uptake regulation protein